MVDFYFFTEPDHLNTQNADQAYGPVDSTDSSYESGKDKFRVTSIHSGSGMQVIAVCDGMIAAQEDSDGNLTLILKPHNQPPFSFPFIEYFLYKGVRKSSLLNGNKVHDVTDTDANDLTKRVAKNWKVDNGNDLTDSDKVLGLDRVVGLTWDDNGNLNSPIEVFQDSDPIEHLFNYKAPSITLSTVFAGEEIGKFGNKCGFEIVLQKLGYAPKIRLTRQFENFIVVPGISSPLDDSNPDNFNYFQHWHLKEAVLSFADPCAFFGAFYPYKLFMKGSGGNENLKKENVYNRIIKHFHNKNKVWLDIRNDYGFSMNYFKNFGYDIQFSEPDNISNQNEITTNRNLWPITVLTISDVPGIQKKDLHKTFLGLPKGDINTPIIFLSKAIVNKQRRQKKKFRVPAITKSPIDDYLEAFPISFVSLSDGGSIVFCSNYYRINLYDNRIVESITPSLRPSKSYYLNGIFQPNNLKMGLDIGSYKSRFRVFREEGLVNMLKIGGGIYSSYIALYEDADHVTFVAFPSYFVQSGAGVSTMPDAFTNWVDSSNQESESIWTKIMGVFKSQEFRKQTLEIPTLINNIDVAVVRNQPFVFADSFRKNENLEDYVFISFQKSDYNSLIQLLNSSTAIDPSFPIFLSSSNESHKTDDNGIRYLEVDLVAIGYKQNGTKVQQVSLSLNQKIYEYADF